MTFVTKITFRSGDRTVLEESVHEVKQFVERKGVELKGPHPNPPIPMRVPLWKGLDGTKGSFPEWTYAVYSRDLEIVGHENAAKQVVKRSYPASIHLTVTVESVGVQR